MRTELRSSAPRLAATRRGRDPRQLTWDQAAAIVRAHGGKVCPGGRPTILAIRDRNRGTPTYDDAFVVLRADGKVKTFAASTRPTSTTSSGGWEPTMVLPGNYELWPRWRDGRFNDDAFVIGTSWGMAVPAARDTNGDGRYSRAERQNPILDSEIRLHRGNASTTSSAGCFNVQDYDGFLRFIGGRDVRLNLTLVKD